MPSIETLQKTIAAFSELTETQLFLKNDKSVWTNGTQVALPLENPHAMRFLEKSVAYILFKSNALALEKFSELYAVQIVEACEAQGVGVTKEQGKQIRSLLHGLCQILESHRVATLWSMIYEGSATLIRGLDRELAAAHVAQAHKNFSVFATLKQAGVDPGNGTFSKFSTVVDTALLMVERRGPIATMAAARWTLIQVVTAMLEEVFPANKQGALGLRAEALMAFVKQGYAIPETLQPLVNGNKVSTATPLTNDKALQLAHESLQIPVTKPADLGRLLEEDTIKMMAIVQKAQSASKGGESPEEGAIRNAECKVVFHDVSFADLDHSENIGASSADVTTIERLRVMFTQMRARSRSQLETRGRFVDMSSVIQSILSKKPRPVFKGVVPGRGFELLILMDRSSSMAGKKKEQVERACRIIADAMNFPFAKLHLWGFHSKEPGCVDIIRFDAKMRIFDSKKSTVGGATPIHVAIHVASAFLRSSISSKHVVVLSDLIPTFWSRGNQLVARDVLIRKARDEVRKARQGGVQVIGGIIPNLKKDQEGGWVPDFSTVSNVRKVFGADRFWSYLDLSDLGTDIVHLAARSFAQYLKS